MLEHCSMIEEGSMGTYEKELNIMSQYKEGEEYGCIGKRMKYE